MAREITGFQLTEELPLRLWKTLREVAVRTAGTSSAAAVSFNDLLARPD
jgi:hypothetical protein